MLKLTPPRWICLLGTSTVMGLACICEAAPPQHTIVLLRPLAHTLHFEGALPDPPAQHLAWITPENTVPAEYVSAAAMLFRQSFADPRGCEYRQMIVKTRSVWGSRNFTETHGWILPGYGQTRFGIAWNGLVYPLLAIGVSVDLRADVAVMVKSHGLRSWTPNEESAVAWNHRTDLKGCLLLRLGKVDLAREVWKATQLEGLSKPIAPADAAAFPLETGRPVSGMGGHVGMDVVRPHPLRPHGRRRLARARRLPGLGQTAIQHRNDRGTSEATVSDHGTHARRFPDE